jgi:Tol biopolymer transport system component
MKYVALSLLLIIFQNLLVSAQFSQSNKTSNELIAFESERNSIGIEYFEVCTMNPDGTNQIQLTENDVYDGSPSISPDGTKITFNSTRDGNYEIYVMNIDGTNVVRLTNNEVFDFTPKWSPDGTKIAFWSYLNGNGDIYVMDSDGSNLISLTDDPADDMFPDWSPDGTKIVFSSTRINEKEIFTMNADGTNQQQITDIGFENNQASWSPDGQKIAFVTDSYSNGVSYDICIINTNGTNLQRLTTHYGHDEFPKWSPDGTKIAFGSSILSNEEIHIMNSDGSNVQLITDNPGLDFPHDWVSIESTNIDNIQYNTDGFELFQNFPNPYTNQTSIQYYLPKKCNITLEIYDITGKQIKTLYNGTQMKGSHKLNFGSKYLPEGIYYYQLSGKYFSLNRKMIVH